MKSTNYVKFPSRAISISLAGTRPFFEIIYTGVSEFALQLPLPFPCILSKANEMTPTLEITKFNFQYFIDLIDFAIPAAGTACKKGSTDQNLTTCAQNKEAVLERLEDDDQAQEEECKTEDHEREDSRPYQRALSGGYGNLFTKN